MPNHLHRLALAGLMLCTTMVALSPVSAGARVACDGTGYVISPGTVSRIASNLRSDYLRGPGSITYQRTTTASVEATISSSVTAEAGIILAKASTQFGVSLGRSWSKSGTWSYTRSVPAGKTARLVMFHESRRFTVSKYRWVNTSSGSCGRQYLYTNQGINAPRTERINVWGLQSR